MAYDFRIFRDISQSEPELYLEFWTPLNSLADRFRFETNDLMKHSQKAPVHKKIAIFRRYKAAFDPPSFLLENLWKWISWLDVTASL